MLGHLSLDVADLATARDYYHDLFSLLGYEPWPRTGAFLAFRPAGGARGPVVFVYEATTSGPPPRRGQPGLGHLAFTVATAADVHEVHRRVLAHGCTVLDPPRDFPEYPPPYFATFWVDPSGVVLEAVCHRPSAEV